MMTGDYNFSNFQKKIQSSFLIQFFLQKRKNVMVYVFEPTTSICPNSQVQCVTPSPMHWNSEIFQRLTQIFDPLYFNWLHVLYFLTRSIEWHTKCICACITPTLPYLAHACNSTNSFHACMPPWCSDEQATQVSRIFGYFLYVSYLITWSILNRVMPSLT